MGPFPDGVTRVADPYPGPISGRIADHSVDRREYLLHSLQDSTRFLAVPLPFFCR